MRIILCAFFLIFTFYYRSFGQDKPPETDIWLIKLNKSENGKFEVSNYKNITNKPGYDNQPYFLADLNSLLYVSDDNGSQTDIYQFYFATGISKKVLNTEFYKEYSPMLSADKSKISCISIEPDNSSQRFWQFPFGGGMGKPYFSDISDVGYYTWIDETQVAFFRLGDPPTLQIGNIETGEMTLIDSDVGRCLQMAKSHNTLFYVKKYDSSNWKIICYDLNMAHSTGSIDLPAGQEDFTLGPNDEIWLSNKGKIQQATLQKPDWKTIIDFSAMPFHNFYRVVFSSEYNMVAVVTYEGVKP